MPSDDLIPVMLPRGDVEDLVCIHDNMPYSGSFDRRIAAAARQALETPPQKDPTKLILEYVEAKKDLPYDDYDGSPKEVRVRKAYQALFDFADSRKGD